MTQAVLRVHPHFNGNITDDLGLASEMAQLRRAIQAWAAQTHPEMHAAMQWQFGSGSKYFRPFTLFSCHRAMSGAPITSGLIHAALAVEMFHNVSLIVDDIVDKSDARRGKATMHRRFGELQAYMVSGYIVADGYEVVCSPQSYEPDEFDPALVRLNVKLLSIDVGPRPRAPRATVSAVGLTGGLADRSAGAAAASSIHPTQQPMSTWATAGAVLARASGSKASPSPWYR